MVLSEDNLMFLSLFAHSAAPLSNLYSPSCARRTTTPTTGSALQKGPQQGVLPPADTEAAATPPTRTFKINNNNTMQSWKLRRIGADSVCVPPHAGIVSVFAPCFQVVWSALIRASAATSSPHCLSPVILTWSHLLNQGLLARIHVSNAHPWLAISLSLS